MCPSLPLADAHGDGISIYVGGKVSNARGPARMSRLAIPFLPNNPPRWPEVVNAVKHLVEVYAKDAHKHERVGEWIERIGWERFFDLTGIPFTEQLIDDFTHASETFRSTAAFKWSSAPAERVEKARAAGAKEEQQVTPELLEQILAYFQKRNKMMTAHDVASGLRLEHALANKALTVLVNDGRLEFTSYGGATFIKLPDSHA